MRIKRTVSATLFAISAAASSTLVHGLDLAFLDQAPLRFFNDADLKLLSDSADKALDSAKDGETVAWDNEQTGSSGTVTPTRSFTQEGHDCRRLKVVNRAAKATRGSATSSLDFCRVDGAWKILSVVE
jgi:surface antigen